ncbi:entericidin A/B family lipoprotein [Pacificoceanicola onchidii]|nr:entericidin A/B family lipoprotein [Pacificoceanicola onchidii]
MKRAVLIIALAMGMAGCATVEGVGEDISSGARKVSGWF